MKRLSAEHKIKIGKAMQKKLCVYKDGKLVKVFDSITIACEELKLIRRNVHRCLEGRFYSHHGYTFQYYVDS